MPVSGTFSHMAEQFHSLLKEETAMKFQQIARLAVGCLLVLPGPAWAQVASATIAGVVKDASGAVMPGVTVEASSPALIEKVRSVVTDEQGQYKIVNLVPGSYT